MRRREFIALFGASVTWPFATLAQQLGAALSSGLLRGPRSDAVVPVFFEAMRRLAFIEGQNLTFDYRAYAQHIDKLSEWAAELSKARVDVITTVGDLAIRAAQEATKPFLSLRSQTIWSKLPFGRAIEFTSPEHNGSQHPCDRARRQTTGDPDRSRVRASPDGRACRF
jgi:hypothetical protein